MPPPNLNSIDLERLRKLMGMFGSEHSGERAAAAQMATELLRRAGLTWQDLFDALTSESPPPPRPRRYEVPEHVEVVEHCLRNGVRLSYWEIEFLYSIREWRWPLSERQEAVLDRICRKCGVSR